MATAAPRRPAIMHRLAPFPPHPIISLPASGDPRASFRMTRNITYTRYIRNHTTSRLIPIQLAITASLMTTIKHQIMTYLLFSHIIFQ